MSCSLSDLSLCICLLVYIRIAVDTDLWVFSFLFLNQHVVCAVLQLVLSFPALVSGGLSVLRYIGLLLWLQLLHSAYSVP